MPRLEIRGYATLRDKMPEEAQNGIIHHETLKLTIHEIVTELSLPRDELYLIFKNEVRTDLEDTVKDGDCLEFYPPIGGG